MQTTFSPRPITASEAEAFFPDLEDIAGNMTLKKLFLERLSRPITHDGNTCVTGAPGTGKTSLFLAYILRQLGSPFMFREHLNPDRWASVNRRTLDEEREWHTTPQGRIFFKQINGATDTEAVIRNKIEEVQYTMFADHSVVLVDELGELYFRGFDEMLRPILTESSITVFATAQNFHSKRRSDTANETDERLSALLRRFSSVISTELAPSNDHLKHLVYLVKAWELKIDRPDTLRLLVDKLTPPQFLYQCS
jgi:predicted ATPase with chaperone activity